MYPSKYTRWLLNFFITEFQRLSTNMFENTLIHGIYKLLFAEWWPVGEGWRLPGTLCKGAGERDNGWRAGYLSGGSARGWAGRAPPGGGGLPPCEVARCYRQHRGDHRPAQEGVPEYPLALLGIAEQHVQLRVLGEAFRTERLGVPLTGIPAVPAAQAAVVEAMVDHDPGLIAARSQQARVRVKKNSLGCGAALVVHEQGVATQGSVLDALQGESASVRAQFTPGHDQQTGAENAGCQWSPGQLSLAMSRLTDDMGGIARGGWAAASPEGR